MSHPPLYRPSEQRRIDEMVRGELHCEVCGLPIGHGNCKRARNQSVWELIRQRFRRVASDNIVNELFGLPCAIAPPKEPWEYESRSSLPKGEDANYFYDFGDGWELHVRENDHTGYAYTTHLEQSGSKAKLGHSLGVIERTLKRTRETNRLIWSEYQEPKHLLV